MNQIASGGFSRDFTGFLHSHKGFSLVEVMMSIVLLALGTALAVPSFHNQVEKRQVTNGAEQFAAFISSVQSQSMRTNRAITVAYDFDSASDWCIGAVAGTNVCVCDDPGEEELACEIGSETFIIDQDIAYNRTLVHGISGGSYTVDPVRGISDAALEVDFRSQTGNYQLRLMVNQTGRVTICSADDEHAIPGYETCPAEELDVDFPVIGEPVEGMPIVEVGS